MTLRKRKKPDSQRLDLHGVRHKDVQREVRRFIEDHVAWGYDCPLTIITGHSEKMRSLVKEELLEYGLHFYVGLGGNKQMKVDMEGWRDSGINPNTYGRL